MPRRFRQPAFACFLLALALRLTWVTIENARQGDNLEWPDEEVHRQIAFNLIHHGEFVTDDGRRAARMPLYPMLLAPFMAAGPAGVAAARYTQAVLAALITPIGVALAARGFGRRCAWPAGLLLALDPYSIYFAGKLLTEVPFAVAAVSLVALAWRRADVQRRVRGILDSRYFVQLEQGWIEGVGGAVAVGALAAAAILLRQSAVPWIGAYFLLLWLGQRPLSRATLHTLMSLVVVGLAILPWGLRNKRVLADYAWLSANGGLTLYDAQGPQADGSSNQAFLKTEFGDQQWGELELDRELTRRALEQMRHDPRRVARLAIAKFGRMWNPFPNVAEYRGGITAWIGAGYTLVLLALGAHGAWRVLRARRSGAGWLMRDLWLPLVVFTALHCVYIGSVRYRVPLMPFLAIAAGGALVVPRQDGRDG